ncbi:MAG: 2-amino-4-oxopentanoate thiolase subunit OrtA [Acidaminobacteraceae bacterium]
MVLSPSERAPQVPDDTKKVPLELWVKGFASVDGNVNDEIEVKTITGRKVIGKVVEINPTFTHSFGNNIPELLQIGLDLKKILFGGDTDEK